MTERESILDRGNLVGSWALRSRRSRLGPKCPPSNSDSATKTLRTITVSESVRPSSFGVPETQNQTQGNNRVIKTKVLPEGKSLRRMSLIGSRRAARWRAITERAKSNGHCHARGTDPPCFTFSAT